jgi:hypothetical protein
MDYRLFLAVVFKFQLTNENGFCNVSTMDIMKKIREDSDRNGVFWLATQVGVRPQTVYNWLAGNIPSVQNLEKLAEYYREPVRVTVKPKEIKSGG